MTAITSNTKSHGASIIPNKFQRSVSPSGNFNSSGISASSSAFASPSMSSFWGPPLISIHSGCVSASPSTSTHRRNASPDRLVASSSSRARIPTGNYGNSNKSSINEQKKTSKSLPTTRPESVQCSSHKNESAGNSKKSNSEFASSSSDWHRLYARRRALKNSLVRIGTVEADLMKWAFASLSRPSSNQRRRRCDFQPKPSRLSVMSKAGD